MSEMWNTLMDIRFFGIKGSSMTELLGAETQKQQQEKATESEQQIEKAKEEAEVTTAAEQAEQAKKAGARRALLALPTSGFGPNKNLARSFLTSL